MAICQPPGNNAAMPPRTTPMDMPSLFSAFIAFVDERGDHPRLSTPADYPVFVLAFCILPAAASVQQVTSAVRGLKFEHFGHDLVILLHVEPLVITDILHLRDQRVMLDAEFAALYGVETKALVQAIKRNLERFPADFMFQLDAMESAALTEQGVAMLSSVLNSPRAIAINIEIMRAFVQMRAMAASHQDPPKRPIGFLSQAGKQGTPTQHQ